MKFNRKSNRNFANSMNNSRRRFRLPFLTKLTWFRKKKQSTMKLSPLSSSYTEDHPIEFIDTLKTTYNKSEITLFNLYSDQYQALFRANKRLLMTRSADDISSMSIKSYGDQLLLKTKRVNHSDILAPSARVSQTIHSSMSTPSKVINHTTKSKCCSMKENSPIHHPSSSYHDKISLQSLFQHNQQHDAAIIEVKYHQSLSMNYTKPISKSYSSPLPIKIQDLSLNNNPIESAHIFDQYQYAKCSVQSLYSCVSEMENDSSTESISSDEKNDNYHLLSHGTNLRRRMLHHRWSLFDIWQKTMILESGQTLMTNRNNNRATLAEEQRYVEQERPIDSHIGLALFALLIFPPIGIFAMILSIWSACGQQDRHLSRKFGIAVYYISLLAICLSFCLLFTMFAYFIYRYLVNQSILIDSPINTTHTYHSLSRNRDYV
ncbi:hypothetical protein I4U23_002371 [Adineta vaga]|nr:hypothetical protein I4U23_002371 [Adineta vaga]